MQWGIYLLEQPRFLLGAENIYDHINGFPPAPPSLAPAGRVTEHGGPLSPWWGPLYLLLFTMPGVPSGNTTTNLSTPSRRRNDNARNRSPTKGWASSITVISHGNTARSCCSLSPALSEWERHS